MSVRYIPIAALVAAVFLAGCKDETPIPHTAAVLKIVSGADQSGDLSKALDSSLVVQVLDAASRPVSGVPLTWTATSGGSVSPASTTTDKDGKSTVKWTLAPTVGNQVVTVTSSQITGVSVSFVASNGAIITGNVTAAAVTPFATFSRSPGHSASFARTSARPRRFSPDRIVVGFRNDALGVARASSMAYRSLAVARDAASRIRQTIDAFPQRNTIRGTEISPSMVAARIQVADTAQRDAVMAALQQDPNVAWVERDEILSIRDHAPRPMSTAFLERVAAERATNGSPATTIATKLPSDPMLFEELWPTNMVDLPRAWNITTGSSNVIVASVDMGIRFDHPEIAANLTNDGYDFVSQVGFGTTESICDGGTFTTIEGDADGPDADPTDPDDLEFDPSIGCWNHSTLGDHGLWTAGIIGGVGNDGVGMAGVNWSVKIRPIRVLGITGDGTTFDIAQGVLYAAGLPAKGANGAMVQAPSRAQIINLSLGGPSPNNTMLSAISAASAAGSLIVAAAGNDGLDLPSFPAAYPSVMAVAAVGMDGALATYSNAGTYISVAAPGGDFRLDDNGGGGVLGPGWNFVTNKATYLFGYGTSAAAPYVSGVAALLLAQTPTLTAAELRSRIEQFATRPPGASRSDMYGWGIVNAFNSLTQQNGPPRSTLVRLINSTTGSVVRTATLNDGGTFAFTRLASGTYRVQAGDDESADGFIGIPGRRFAWAGGFGAPTVLNVNGNAQSVSIALGTPTEVEPNNDTSHANVLSVDGYVVGNITTPDVADVYSVYIPAAGTYTFETSGLVGSCGLGIELDTFISIVAQAGTVVSSNDNSPPSPTGRFCSRAQASLTPGVYFVTVRASSQATTNFTADHGRYRLQVRAGQ